MKRPEYSVAALRAFVEEKLGVCLVRFEQITECSRPENFRVQTEHGVRYVVKCVLPEKSKAQYFRNHFLPHLPFEFYREILSLIDNYAK